MQQADGDGALPHLGFRRVVDRVFQHRKFFVAQCVLQSFAPIRHSITVGGLSTSGLAERYRLERVIAATNLSVVYRGVDTSVNRAVAVKLLAEPALIDRFKMVASHQRQRAYYEYNYPSTEITLDIRGERDNRSGSRLWERRPDDGDFGEIRIGIGTRPSTVAYTLGGEGDGASSLLRDTERLQSDSRYLDNAPITLPLYQPPEHKGAPVRHLIGITGAPADVYALIDAMMAHLVVFHSPWWIGCAPSGIIFTATSCPLKSSNCRSASTCRKSLMTAPANWIASAPKIARPTSRSSSVATTST
jgi:hypothetical protein